MMLIWAVWFVSLGFIKAQEILSGKPASCTTPNNDVGICVEVRQCAIFMEVIRYERQESYDFLRESQCGTSIANKSPKVCCGMYDNYLNQLTLQRSAKLEAIPQDDPFPKVCGDDSMSSSWRILGGIQADLGQFPWMARLRHLRSDSLLSYGCAGFLISEKFVLTAAHCIKSSALASLGPVYQVQLGEHDTETDPDCTDVPRECADKAQFLRTTDPIVHPDYSNDRHYHHDIAIIPLLDPATLSRYVQPICLPNTPSNDRNFWVSGWGRTETDYSSTVKLAVSVPEVDRNRCSGLYRSRGIRILDSQLCAGGVAGKDSCTGDSGGPLMLLRNNSWYAQGIVSLGVGCGEKGWPAVYTYLPNYIDWITLVVNQYLEQEQEK